MCIICVHLVFFVIYVANEYKEYIVGIYIVNLYNEYISFYTDSDLDSATSNDADFNGNKFTKNPNSKLSTNTGNIFPSESDVLPIDSVSNNLSNVLINKLNAVPVQQNLGNVEKLFVGIGTKFLQLKMTHVINNCSKKVTIMIFPFPEKLS